MSPISALQSVKPTSSVIEWLLDSDPAIRWQVMRDLTHAPEEAVAAERSRIATEGWGAELLSRQAADGRWGDGQSAPLWLTTLNTMQLLWEMGLDPKSEQARRAVGLLRDKVTWLADPGWNLHSGSASGNPYFEGEVEPCINGRVLGFGGYFGQPNKRLFERLLSEQLEDGGWNCEVENGSVRSSFHTTIAVLEGLWEYEKATGFPAEASTARMRGQEYLLERRMLRSRSTGEVITLDRKTEQTARWTHFSYPTTWHYDLLRGLDYLRNAGATPDERVAEAVAVVAKKKDPDGLWRRENIHSDPVNLDMDDGEGKPSRWNTLRALRVLDWYSARD